MFGAQPIRTSVHSVSTFSFLFLLYGQEVKTLLRVQSPELLSENSTHCYPLGLPATFMSEGACVVTLLLELAHRTTVRLCLTNTVLRPGGEF